MAGPCAESAEASIEGRLRERKQLQGLETGLRWMRSSSSTMGAAQEASSMLSRSAALPATKRASLTISRRTPLGQEHIRLRIQLQPGAELAGRFSGSFRNCPNLRAILRKQGQDKIRLPQRWLSQHEHAGVVGALRHGLFERYRRDVVRGVEVMVPDTCFEFPRPIWSAPEPIPTLKPCPMR